MTPLDEAVRLTEILLARSQERDHDVLPSLRRQRDAALLAGLGDATLAPARKRAAVRRIKALNDEIVAVLERERDEAAQALRQLRSRQQAASRYLTVGG